MENFIQQNLPDFACVQAGNLVDGRNYRLTMNPWQALRANLKALMAKKGMSKRELAKAAEIGENTLYRMFREDEGYSLDLIARLAAVFRRQAWELLSPKMGAGEEPLSELAMLLARSFDALPEEKRAAAYAIIEQVVVLGNTGPGLPARADAPSPAPPPGPGKPPAGGPISPVPTRTPEKAHARSAGRRTR
jgi:transcriptional regulator with XRE-family HTH domain